MFKRINLFFICALVFISTGCGRSSAPSPLEYAIYSGEHTVGGPLGRLELMAQGFELDFKTIEVCVQKTPSGFESSDLLLEVKLAHAMWLAAAGYDENEFHKFNFTLQQKCDKEQKQWSTVVALADFSNENPKDQFRTLFNEPRAVCKTLPSRQRTCNGTKAILGWGGPGQLVRYSFPDKPQVWVKLKNSAPSSAVLSPYVQWRSISESIGSLPELSPKDKENLTASLTRLKHSKQSFRELLDFANVLLGFHVKTPKDPIAAATFQRFFATKEPSLDTPYTPQLTAFKTLVHEIGHGFGLHHAHEPSKEAITGPSATAVWDDVRQQYLTKDSVMAYAESITYLTDDDIKGVRAASAEVRRAVSRHK